MPSLWNVFYIKSGYIRATRITKHPQQSLSCFICVSPQLCFMDPILYSILWCVETWKSCIASSKSWVSWEFDNNSCTVNESVSPGVKILNVLTRMSRERGWDWRNVRLLLRLWHVSNVRDVPGRVTAILVLSSCPSQCQSWIQLLI